jgi:hypothetical protein
MVNRGTKKIAIKIKYEKLNDGFVNLGESFWRVSFAINCFCLIRRKTHTAIVGNRE